MNINNQIFINVNYNHFFIFRYKFNIEINAIKFLISFKLFDYVNLIDFEINI